MQLSWRGCSMVPHEVVPVTDTTTIPNSALELLRLCFSELFFFLLSLICGFSSFTEWLFKNNHLLSKSIYLVLYQFSFDTDFSFEKKKKNPVSSSLKPTISACLCHWRSKYSIVNSLETLSFSLPPSQETLDPWPATSYCTLRLCYVSVASLEDNN